MRRSGVRRGAFTLIELLVMIAILLVLMALVTASTTRVLRSATEARARDEIGRLADAVEAFKMRYHRYPPSKIRLRELGGYDFPVTISGLRDPLDEFSAEYLRALFTNINLDAGHDWNGDGQIGGVIDLEGDECLVYFLGGLPQRAASGEVLLTGFNPDKANPTKPTPPSVKREGPFFEFKASRLAWPAAERVKPNVMPVYRDPFGTPYVYYRVTEQQCGFH